jgi:hypothetical protein
MADTATAHITLDDGVLLVRIREGAHQRPADARENLSLASSATQGVRRPLLIDITKSQPLDAETRHVYSGQPFVEGFMALALLIEDTPLGRMMGNVFLRVARPGIPTQLFTSEASAIEWLRGHR